VDLMLTTAMAAEDMPTRRRPRCAYRSVDTATGAFVAYVPLHEVRYSRILNGVGGFTIDDSRRRLQIARRSVGLSDAQFLRSATALVASVERAYWDLVFALREPSRETADGIRADHVDLGTREIGKVAPVHIVDLDGRLDLGDFGPGRERGPDRLLVHDGRCGLLERSDRLQRAAPERRRPFRSS